MSWLLSEHEKLRIDEAEAIDNHFASDRLHRVHNDTDGARIQLLERLLRVNVGAGKPTSETRVRMVPPDDLKKLPTSESRVRMTPPDDLMELPISENRVRMVPPDDQVKFWTHPLITSC